MSSGCTPMWPLAICSFKINFSQHAVQKDDDEVAKPESPRSSPHTELVSQQKRKEKTILNNYISVDNDIKAHQVQKQHSYSNHQEMSNKPIEVKFPYVVMTMLLKRKYQCWGETILFMMFQTMQSITKSLLTEQIKSAMAMIDMILHFTQVCHQQCPKTHLKTWS